MPTNETALDFQSFVFTKSDINKLQIISEGVQQQEKGVLSPNLEWLNLVKNNIAKKKAEVGVQGTIVNAVARG